ncbi:hypothetical protein [Arthrobacter sp. zg-Y750]|uniref:hypothetical protein n=1 Tax=Arthrobacter sp. zg-Y750 TaxID=2894189 RepID=UPI001E3826BE|nr:hypothetical protein [Arthrobacter sp. zg-Y750]MCC9178618.1 hypothetical protein [Arthrobacter sp. zg-Y750]
MKTDNEFDREDLNWSHPRTSELRDIDEQISRHPGKRLMNRLDELRRVLDAWAGFSMMLSDLLRACENEDKFAVELLRNVGDQTGRQTIVRALDQATIAYVAGLGAVIEHTRSVVNKQSEGVKSEYGGRTAALVEKHPAAPFLGKLRNYVLHNVAAPWEFSGSFGEQATCRIALTSEVLLEDKKSWNAEARNFIVASGKSIQLSPLLTPYMEAMVEHVGLVIPAVIRENEASLDECNALIKKRNLLLTDGVSDGSDWEARMAHITENFKRVKRGERQTDFRTGEEMSADGGANGQRNKTPPFEKL